MAFTKGARPWNHPRGPEAQPASRSIGLEAIGLIPEGATAARPGIGAPAKCIILLTFQALMAGTWFQKG